eukprot:TRINITY_DN115_c2_g1_i4.p1 TRINITY_DN115_c2_g1~~TRINITY_DN115_c2_g1_i4.p1  ORF type:complete len:700 (+),score=275.41 TRINITY_DN115_c2_g1_i4:2145-4244(+)
MIRPPKPDFGSEESSSRDSDLLSRLSNASTPKASSSFSVISSPTKSKGVSFSEPMEEGDSLILNPLRLLPSDDEEEEDCELQSRPKFTSSSVPSVLRHPSSSKLSSLRRKGLGSRPAFDLDFEEEGYDEGPSSPPTQGVMSLNLFESPMLNKHATSSPASSHGLLHRRSSSSQIHALKPNVLFSHGKPSALKSSFLKSGNSSSSLLSENKAKRANLNPFTPEGLLVSHQKRARLRMNLTSPGGSFSELQKSLDQMSDSDDNEFSSSLTEFHPPVAKRIRVSDIHISRYSKEFVELQSLASGEYGCVKVARHRLDGMVYAIKVTKKVIQPCSHAEHVAMNEVFAHAAIMKHKHVIRYFNSWVENCQVYIQTEYCEGGSLQSSIDTYRKRNRRFPESELRTILSQIAKGLHYIHSKDMVHMDIKPENIFIAVEHPSSPSTSPGGSIISDAPARHSGNESTDSGNHSGNDAANPLRVNNNNVILNGQRLTYKIGDLGNIAQIHGDYIPEEGDCRYMAPELLAIDVDRSKLPKADVFSLGLSLYAMASLQDIPKNSMDDSVMYDQIKRGELPYLDAYSKEFNQVLRSMISPDPNARPSPTKLMNIFTHNSNHSVKSRSQLCKELKDSEARIRELEELLNQKTSGGGGPSGPSSSSSFIMDSSLSSSIASVIANHSSSSPVSKVTSTPSRSVGKGTNKSTSCIL